MDRDLDLFRKLVDVFLDTQEHEPVLASQTPKELINKIDLALSRTGISDTALEETLQQILLNTPRSGGRFFFNQLYGKNHSKAVLGDLLSVILNTGMHTYKVNGIQVVIEEEIIQEICRIVDYGSTASGIFVPGGSMANLMGLLMARDTADTDVSRKGITQNMIAYTSENSHYSMDKNIRFAGLGYEHLRKIETDEHGRMLPLKLKEAIEQDLAQGHVPFFVKATAGTTVLGCFDPLDDIADICKEYNLWLHVDGSFGGSCIFSKDHQHLVSGINRAHSFGINAHKMLGTPLTCSMIFVKDKDQLIKSFGNDASYLFQTEEGPNPGKHSMQCARKNDALKFWTLWKSIGTNGLGEMVDREFVLAEHARNYVKNHSDYRLYHDHTSVTVCFNYKDYDPVKLSQLLYEQGEIMVGHASSKGNTFIRLVTVNSQNAISDIDEFFSRLEAFAEKHQDLLK